MTDASLARCTLIRSSVEEVIELLSAPTSGSDGTAGFEDETSKMHDSAQYDSWRNSLTKVYTTLYTIHTNNGVDSFNNVHTT